jgi:hypothetical protein
LAGKDLVKAKIVPYRSQHRRLASRGNGAQAAPIIAKPTDEFRGEMLRLSSTPSVPSGKYCSSRFQNPADLCASTGDPLSESQIVATGP